MPFLHPCGFYAHVIPYPIVDAIFQVNGEDAASCAYMLLHIVHTGDDLPRKTKGELLQHTTYEVGNLLQRDKIAIRV